ncbi:MAG: phosphatase PAP2 family protein [Bacillota bacterium]|nr:phosphatase PAP2 family protein [Bacillota bacterium]
MVASVYLLSTVLYLQTNRLAANVERAVILKFPIDDQIPFVRFFVLPYYAWFALVAAVFLWLVFDRRQNRRVYRHTTAIVLAMVLSTLIFLVYPTHVPRPVITGQDWLSRLVLMIYAADEPYNCFPSLHVAVAAIKGMTLFRYGPRRIWFRILTVLLVVLIMLSTVLIKQHYVPDLVGGLALALICDVISRRLFPDRIIERSFLPA